MKTEDLSHKGYDVIGNCRKLAEEMTFKNLYSIICAHGNIEAAVWLEGDDPHSMTFDQLAQLTDNYAEALSHTFGQSGRVCIAVDACKEWFPLFWGIIRSGHDVLTVDPSMPDEKVAYLMRQAGCTYLVSSKARKVSDGTSQLLVSDLAKAPVISNYLPVWGHDIALCTSGTTAECRVYVYDEEAICHHALFSEKVYNDNKNLIDNKPFRTLAFLPFHHILGFSAIFIWSNFLGYTTIFLKDRTPQTIVKTAKIAKITQIVTVPILANNLSRTLTANVKKQGWPKRLAFKAMTGTSLTMQHVFPKAGARMAASMFKGVREQMLGHDMKSIILGGSHTAPETMKLLNAIGYYTVCGFGMTETAINSFETSHILANRLGGSVGTTLPFTEYKIKGDKETGELMVRGKGIHTYRLVNGERLPQEVDAEGWFSTGDIARMDKRMRFHIEGRIKDVIINESGENVYPDELEDKFSGMKGVEQFAIVGLPKNGSKIYEDIAYVARIAGNAADDEALEGMKEELARINATLPVYKRLRRALVTTQPLPLTSTMKVKRITLKQLVATKPETFKELDITSAGKAKAAKKTSEKKQEKEADDIRKNIKEIFSEVLSIPVNKIDDNANFIEDLGGDSLQMMEITVKAEEKFGIFIPAEASARCMTVDGADEYVHELLRGETTEVSGRLTEHQAITSFEDTPEYHDFKKRMDSLMSEGEDNPYFVSHDSPSLDTSIINGREVIDFGNYNYAGMSGRKEVSEAAIAAIRKYGTSAGGSRLLAGEKPIHKELERSIAEWKNAESALVCVGGHSTNVTVVGNFCGKNDLIIYDALAHNSIEQGCKLSDAKSKSFPHNDFMTLERMLKAQRKYFEKVLIVVEGVYSMDGDIAPIPEFVRIKKEYGCFLMVDEAHSSCVLGDTGGGVDEYFHLDRDDIDIKYGTLSKGLGTCGGYIAGKASLVEYLRYNLPGFVFSVGISPALAAGATEAIRLLRNEPSIMKRLHSNIAFFADEARKRHLDICLAGQAAILPVLIGKDEDAFVLSSELLKRGISVPPAVYPAVPKNKARLRFDVISEHKPEQIVYALDTLVSTAKELGIALPTA